MIARICSRSCSDQRQAGRRHRLGAESAFLLGELDVLDELDMRVQVQERRVPAIDGARLLPAPGHGEVPQQPILGRECVHQSRYPAGGAEHEALEHQIVHPAEQGIAIAADVLQVGDPPDVLRRFLDRHQPGLVAQLDEHLRCDVHGVRHRVVVDHDRQVGRPSDGPIMNDRLSRVGLVDHRRQHHEPLHAEALGIGRELASPRRGALGDAGQHGDSPGHMVDRRPENLQLLRVFQRAVLADRSQHDQSVNPGVDHPIEVVQSRRDIQRLVGLKLGRGRREDPLPCDAHEDATLECHGIGSMIALPWTDRYVVSRLVGLTDDGERS